MSESAQDRADRLWAGFPDLPREVIDKIAAGIFAAEQSARDSREPEVDELKGELALGEAENERLRAAIETLVADEIISAGRARELHGMTPDEQREHWRAVHRGGEGGDTVARVSPEADSGSATSPSCSICRRSHGPEVKHACE